MLRSILISTLLLISASTGCSDKKSPVSVDIPENDPSLQYKGICTLRASESASLICPQTSGDCNPGCDYYISNSGDDSNSGTSPEAPWKSISMISDHASSAGGTFCLARGETFRGEITFDDFVYADPASPVVITSWGDRNQSPPTIAGSKVLSGTWQVSDISPQVMMMDVSGILWEGLPYERFGTTWTPHDMVFQLFIDGEIQTLARFPDTATGESVMDEGVVLTAGHYSLIDETSGRTYKDSAIEINDLSGDEIDWTGAGIIYRSNRWIIMRNEVESSNTSDRSFTATSNLECADNCEGFGYMLIDHIAAISTPGEWFYDEESKHLYLYPPQGINPAEAEVEVSVYRKHMEPPAWASSSAQPELERSYGISLRQGRGIEVRGVNFKHYSGAAVYGVSTISDASADDPTGSTEIRIEDCRMEFTGASGVNITKWGDINSVPGNILITGNTFIGQSSQAIYLQVPDSEISCNSISDIGNLEHYSRFGMDGSGLTVHDQGKSIMSTGNNHLILYNRFERTSSAAISFRNKNTLIAYNFIKNACYTKADCGGIETYTWDDGFSSDSIQGSVISSNIILHTLGGSEGCGNNCAGPLGQGMFLDFGAQNYAVRKNVVADSTTAGLLLQRNSGVLVRDNILYANNRVNNPGWLMGQIMIISADGVSTSAVIENNTMFAAQPHHKILGVRNEKATTAAEYKGNGYYHPFAFDCETDNHYWTDFTSFEVENDEMKKFHIARWQQYTGETMEYLSWYWHRKEITQYLSENLITNGDFEAGTEGWTVNSWSDVTINSAEHSVWGSSLQFHRNGAEGGGIDAISPPFILESGKTYEIRFWFAPDDSNPLTAAVLRYDGGREFLIPSGESREITLVFTAETSGESSLLFGAYPFYPDTFYIDSVSIREVVASDFVNSAVIRFSENIPDSRSVLIYNDTDNDEVVALPSPFAEPGGEIHTQNITVPSFGAVIIVPESQTIPPVH